MDRTNSLQMASRIILIRGDTANSETQHLLASRETSHAGETFFRVQKNDFDGGENLRETMSDRSEN